MFHSQHRIPASRLLSLLHHPTSFHSPFLPFRATILDSHQSILDNSLQHPLWNIVEHSLLSHPTKFPYLYGIRKENVFDIEPSSFQTYHVFSKHQWYKHSVTLSNIFSQEHIILLYSIDPQTMDRIRTK